MPHRAGREQTRAREWTLSALIWSLVLLAAPFLAFPAGQALPWALGAAVLLGVFPTVLVRYLQRRNDLRRFPPASLPPVVLGAVALAFILQRMILWLQGPLALSAAVFGLLAAALVLAVANSVGSRSWTWLDLTLGAGAVMLAATAFLLVPGPAGVAAAVLAAVVLLAVLGTRMRGGTAVRHAAAAAAGAAAGGGVYLWLLGYAL